MCFSAAASFGVGAALVPAGIYCVRNAVRQRQFAMIPLAVVPLFFALQQGTEGLVWVGLNHAHPDLVTVFSFLFLFFALCFWLFWIPFSLMCLAEPGVTRWLLAGVVIPGLAAGLYLYLPLVCHPEVLTTRVVHHSIQYDYPFSPLFPSIPPVVRHTIYLGIIALPLFAVRSRQGMGFCVVLVLSAVISHFVYSYAFTSVWCFFAALLSAYLCVIFRSLPAVETAPRILDFGRQLPHGKVG
jgi:hypothetical protein